MNTDDIIALQKVTKLYTREHMYKMLDKRKEIINDALDKISQQELKNEEYELEELIAFRR